jgi:hypothetical protein
MHRTAPLGREAVSSRACHSDPPERALRPCESCVHARRIAAELWCGQSSARYLCSDERSLPRLQALWMKACGSSGRYFTPAD